MATISRLREKEGRQKAVPVLVLFEPALVLPDHSTRRVLTVVALFFHPPTHPQIKRKKGDGRRRIYAVNNKQQQEGHNYGFMTALVMQVNVV